MRPSVVACSSLTTPQRTRWAASFRRDHTVNGRPRSCGRVPTTSRMTLTSSGAYFDGRPAAFRGRSAAKPPALNRRINARTYSSWRYNRPAMARARIPAPRRRRPVRAANTPPSSSSSRPSQPPTLRERQFSNIQTHGNLLCSHVCPYWIRRALKVQDAFRYEALGTRERLAPRRRRVRFVDHATDSLRRRAGEPRPPSNAHSAQPASNS